MLKTDTTEPEGFIPRNVETLLKVRVFNSRVAGGGGTNRDTVIWISFTALLTSAESAFVAQLSVVLAAGAAQRPSLCTLSVVFEVLVFI